jgi:hypothetical protein
MTVAHSLPASRQSDESHKTLVFVSRKSSWDRDVSQAAGRWNQR